MSWDKFYKTYVNFLGEYHYVLAIKYVDSVARLWDLILPRAPF